MRINWDKRKDGRVLSLIGLPRFRYRVVSSTMATGEVALSSEALRRRDLFLSPLDKVHKFFQALTELRQTADSSPEDKTWCVYSPGGILNGGEYGRSGAFVRPTSTYVCCMIGFGVTLTDACVLVRAGCSVRARRCRCAGSKSCCVSSSRYGSTTEPQRQPRKS